MTVIETPTEMVSKIPENQLASRAKETLVSFATKMDGHLEAYFNRELESPFGVNKEQKILSEEILNHIKEHNLRPAKRARATFIYYGYNIFSGHNKEGIVVDEDKVLQACMAIELIHTALLMHDDKMDKDSTRRGKPTTHKHYENVHENNYKHGNSSEYGDNMAVDVGDVTLMLGFQLLDDCGLDAERVLKASSYLHRAITNTAFGQAYDITLEAEGDATEDNVIALHHAKTSIYTYQTPIIVGAMLGGATDKDLDLLSKYAIPGGIAFQLQDDVLGLFGDPNKTGKPAHSDLRQRKQTLLIIKAMQLGNAKQRKQLERYWGKDNLTDGEAGFARKIVIDTGSLDYSKKLSVKWAKRAQEAIPEMRNKGWDKESIDYLHGITQYMVLREL